MTTKIAITLTCTQVAELLLAADDRLTILWEQDGGDGTEESPHHPSRATRRQIDALQRGRDRLAAAYAPPRMVGRPAGYEPPLADDVE